MIEPNRQVHGYVTGVITVDNELGRSVMGFGDQSHLAIRACPVDTPIVRMTR
jgi:hypothetical protein